MTNIEWTNPPGYKGDVWNPTTGCDKVSPGCANCYAKNMAWRLSHIETTKAAYEGTVYQLANGDINWTGKINLLEDRLSIPLRRKKPTAWFVNSMSDLFHEDIPFDYIDKVFAVMALCPQHIFQILTKRDERMREYMLIKNPLPTTSRIIKAAEKINEKRKNYTGWSFGWPHPNVWLGVSVEDQPTFDRRVFNLLSTPAAVKFISYEPGLGPIDATRIEVKPGRFIDAFGLDYHDGNGTVIAGPPADVKPLNWVIVGGESGPGARPFDIDWARQIVAQCKAASVPVFVKQLGSYPITSDLTHAHGSPTLLPDSSGYSLKLRDKKGGNIEEFPKDLQVREYPEVVA